MQRDYQVVSDPQAIAAGAFTTVPQVAVKSRKGAAAKVVFKAIEGVSDVSRCVSKPKSVSKSGDTKDIITDSEKGSKNVDSAKGVLQCHPEWMRALKDVRSIETGRGPRSICITGKQNVGKSTLCRYVINSLLNKYDKVAFLDTDLGVSHISDFLFLMPKEITFSFLFNAFALCNSKKSSSAFKTTQPLDFVLSIISDFISSESRLAKSSLKRISAS